MVFGIVPGFRSVPRVRIAFAIIGVLPIVADELVTVPSLCVPQSAFGYFVPMNSKDEETPRAVLTCWNVSGRKTLIGSSIGVPGRRSTFRRVYHLSLFNDEE